MKRPYLGGAPQRGEIRHFALLSISVTHYKVLYSTCFNFIFLSRAHWELLRYLLEMTEMPTNKSEQCDAEKILKKVMQMTDVWFFVLSILKPSSTLHSHRKVKMVVWALRCLRERIERHNFRVGYLLDLTEKEVNILARLIDAFEGNISRDPCDSAWKIEILRDWNKVRDLQKTFSKMECSIQFVQKLVEGVAEIKDIQELNKELNKRRRFVNSSVNEVLDSGYWGPLFPFVDLAETIHSLQDSTVFFNIARDFLTADHGGLLRNTECASAVQVIELLSSKIKPNFQQVCDPLFDRDNDLTTQEVNVLLRGITTKEELHKELQLLSNYFGKSPVQRDRERMLASYLQYPLVRRKVQQVMPALHVFGYDNTNCPKIMQSLEEVLILPEMKQMTLKSLCKTLESKAITDVDSNLNKDLTDIASVLGESRELLAFIEETVDEDMVVLIDVVEEHSDQFISEATVSHLIDVHRFLRNLVKDKPTEPMAFLCLLRNCYDNLREKKGMAAKIDECSRNVHSLRAIYKNLANREEMTKEIISNALRKGKYQLGRNDHGSWEVLLTYNRETNRFQNEEDPGDKAGSNNKDQDTCYKLTDIQDLRSRALLIVNIDSRHHDEEKRNNVHTGCSAADLNEFVKQVDLIMEILSTASLLHNSGHPEYKTYWVKKCSTHEIEEEAKSLAQSLESWKDMLETAQEKFFFLNYFHPDQLWILNDFFRGKPKVVGEGNPNVRVVHDLLRFIEPSLPRDDLKKLGSLYKYPSERETVAGDLRAIGRTLNDFFLPKAAPSLSKDPKPRLRGAVQPGELYVAVLEQGSVQTVPVVMSLFELTSCTDPQPSQVLFCHSDTTWEEIQRLLRRAFEGFNHLQDAKLHCLANVESLPNDMQFDLVAAIKDFQSVSNAPYLLSLVCRGGPHHHIVDQFADSARSGTDMTDVKLKAKFNKAFPKVFVVTSELPGTGKTESIFNEATRREKNVVSFPISGPLSRSRLVHRLTNLPIKEYDCIHLDVGEVDDPLALDTFLFELVAIGMVSSGTHVYHLPTEDVYIEIANTLKNWLQDSLPVTKCFSPMHITLKGYENYVVSQEPSSPIQVVCHYLHAYDSGTLESKQITFCGPNKAKPLQSEKCKALLTKHFSLTGDISYNIVETFLGVFADQLLKFSASPFLKPNNLEAMLGPSHDVRTRLFVALLQVSKEFAVRSVASCKSVQSEAISDKRATEVLIQAQCTRVKTANQMVDRVKGMIRWSDNNHLLIVFQTQQELTISALYRELSLVPQRVRDLFNSQAVKGMAKGLEDYSNLTQEELQQKLDLLARSSAKAGRASSSLKYALTPDNVLKMFLILLRIRANIPVIIMGETGCGKTSLVRYLAETCDVPYHAFNFHAGVTEDQIIEFVEEMSKMSKNALCPGGKRQPVWVFLDEINTCDHLGTINEIMCHRTLGGKPLPSNLAFIAACNPYRLRPLEKILTSGLSEKVSTDEYSGLVYRVHPLPETMIDYVWDYGSVGPEDEKRYIARMVDGVLHDRHRKLLIDLLFSSQDYIRRVDNTPFCVSLRDVDRCIILIEWFYKILQEREELSPDKIPPHIQTFYQKSRKVSRELRSIVLALAHCYQSRLQEIKTRDEFSEVITNRIKDESIVEFQAESFQAIVRVEQEEYLARMELPKGTAKNAALRENVFVILVCILNRIPVFVVGKPGCSKSLSMQVIRSNLRGKDSKDPFLKQLPQLYVVSYQGSESSTSEGIFKVFEKAKRYKEGSNDVLPVVLLDEIGLAEVSAFNPLKILHSLLEPGNCKLPDVAVVGISNWCLDPAKMNRAVHLSRPEPDITDLFETGQSIRGAQYTSSRSNCLPRSYPDDYQLECLAKSYHGHQKIQRHDNFHGLRDYYSLVKSLSSDCGRQREHMWETKRIQRALQRNFGGIPLELMAIQQKFMEHFQSERVPEEIQTFPVTDLICDNLQDRFARHMMIITNGDSAIGILDQTLRNMDKEKVTIFGSRFEEDQTEEYNFSILSRIILCMERDCVLILRDLESIYGSLYDMLNQNYTVVGQKKNCRIALGPFSNSMCQVHDEFRCIVLIDEKRVDYTDPPFLNRFEKQLLRFSDVLSAEQEKAITYLEAWANAISTGPELESHFNETDMFIGFSEDTLPSLVLHISKDDKIKKDEITDKCKHELMWIASPDGVLRSINSHLSRTSVEEVLMLYRNYFSKPIHRGLKEYMRHVLEDLQTNSEKDGGLKLLVMTHSNIHTNISHCLTGLGKCQTEKLSAFKSEKQLAKQVQKFWTSDANILVLQCKPDLDAPHMLVAKHLIEEQRHIFISSSTGLAERQTKHVCLVVHVQRAGKSKNVESPQWQFSFQSGWRKVTIDMLEEPVVPITELLDVSVTDLLHTKSFSFERIASEQLLWCFTRIKYQTSEEPTLDAVLHLIKWLKSSPEMMTCFKTLIVRLLKNTEISNVHSPLQGISWQLAVARDRQALFNSSTLVGAVQHHFNHLIREPLAKIVYFLERESAWPKEVFSNDPVKDKSLQVWTELLFDEDIFNIEDIPNSQGAESYFVPGRRHKLEYPFASIFSKKVDKIKSLFMEDLRRLQLEGDNHDDNGELEIRVFEKQLRRFVSEVRGAIPQITEGTSLQRIAECYVNDLLDIKTADFAGILSRHERIHFLKSVLSQHIRIPTGGNVALVITQLHCVFWMKESFFISALNLFVTCRDFVPAAVTSLTSEFLEIFNKTMFENHDVAMAKTDPADLQRRNEEVMSDQGDDAEQKELQVSKEEKRDEEASEDDLPLTFVEQLVETFCRALFPTHSVVTYLKGPEQWQRSVSRLLSLVSRMQLSVPSFHFLRVCHDYVSQLLLPESLDLYILYTIGETGLAYASEGCLDSQGCFEKIDQLIDTRETTAKNVEDSKEFRALFYTRCIDSNPDTPALGSILSKISCSGDNTLVKLAGPVIHRVFVSENHFSPGIFEELLHDPTTVENHPGLQQVSQALSSLTGKVELDCPFVVLCCDLVSDVGFPPVDFSTISRSENKCIKTLRKATQILMKPHKDELDTFSLVCAVAYLKSFLGSFATLTVQTPCILASENEYAMLLRELGPVFSSRESNLATTRSSQSRLYFLRELRKKLPLDTIKKITEDSNKLAALKDFDWHHEDQKLVGKLSFDPFAGLTKGSKAKIALASLVKEKHQDLLRTELNSVQDSADQKTTLAAVFTTWFYLVRSVRSLRDSEEKATDFINDEIGALPLPYVALLQRITGKKDFQVQELCLSSESSSTDAHRAALILHLCIILTSSYKESKSTYRAAFLSYLVNPRSSKNTFMLALPNSPQRPFETYQNYSERGVSTKTCSCGTLFVFEDQRDSSQCPECHEQCKSDFKRENKENSGKLSLSTKGYVLVQPSDEESCCLLCVRCLSPSHFRVLHLLVHAALYGGIALEMFDAQTLSEIMVIKDKEDSAAEICFQHILKDLGCLCHLLNCPEEEVIMLLHRILDEAASILTSISLCTTEEMRDSWEKTFSDTIGPLIHEFCVKRKVTIPNCSDSFTAAERQIEECDNPQYADANERNIYVPRLFRATSSKSFESLRAYYMHLPKEIKACHPLLGLFLDFHIPLHMVTHLNNFLVLARMLETQLGRKMSRTEASKATIGDIIRGEHSSKVTTTADKEGLRNAFENFKTSWEKVRPVVAKKMGPDVIVPRITEMSPISLCLVERKGQGLFLCTALDALQEIQNGLMEKALSIAASGKCDGLKFLERGDGRAAVQVVHLQDAQEKEIIHYQWSNDILRHSQHNTEYGQGKEIFYDIGRIEKEMAVRFLLGKAYLSTADGLRGFTFAKELFRSFKGILDELERIVPQQPLTEHAKTGVRQLKERSLKGVQDLLEHMEIALCVLKKHQSGNPSEPLIEFTDRWLSESRPFPKSLLPEPGKAILLKHVVALYEVLEDMLSESAVEGIHDMYRDELPDDIKDQVLKGIENSTAGSDHLPLESVTTALSRFIFRYISTDDSRPEPRLPLLEHLLEHSLWPMEIVRERKAFSKEQWTQGISSVIPEGLTLGHIHAVLSLYQNQLKVGQFFFFFKESFLILKNFFM